jgi:hypothetical protein
MGDLLKILSEIRVKPKTPSLRELFEILKRRLPEYWFQFLENSQEIKVKPHGYASKSILIREEDGGFRIITTYGEGRIYEVDKIITVIKADFKP